MICQKNGCKGNSEEIFSPEFRVWAIENYKLHAPVKFCPSVRICADCLPSDKEMSDSFISDDSRNSLDKALINQGRLPLDWSKVELVWYKPS